MSFKETTGRIKDRAIAVLSGVEDALHAIYRKLLTERHWFVVITAAAVDFWQQRIYYYTSYFTYNAFLASLALIIAGSSIFGFLLSSNPELQQKAVTAFKDTIPVFVGAPSQNVQALATYRNVVGVIGILALIWTGTKIFAALEWGFCQIWGSPRRNFAKKKLLGLVLVTVIGLLFVLSILAQFAFTAVWHWMVGQHDVLRTFGDTVFKPLLAGVVNFFLFMFTFKVVPTVKQKWSKCAWGALVSAALFLGLNQLLGYYFGHISSIPEVYGTIATPVVLIMWLHVTGMVLFYGGEVVHVLSDRDLLEQQRTRLEIPKVFPVRPS
ncbi:MAG: YihY/virulence factor BrkB family protein [Actinomycetota bacterium]